jgi:hypothetical protein
MFPAGGAHIHQRQVPPMHFLQRVSRAREFLVTPCAGRDLIRCPQLNRADFGVVAGRAGQGRAGQGRAGQGRAGVLPVGR